MKNRFKIHSYISPSSSFIGLVIFIFIILSLIMFSFFGIIAFIIASVIAVVASVIRLIMPSRKKFKNYNPATKTLTLEENDYEIIEDDSQK